MDIVNVKVPDLYTNWNGDVQVGWKHIRKIANQASSTPQKISNKTKKLIKNNQKIWKRKRKAAQNKEKWQVTTFFAFDRGQNTSSSRIQSKLNDVSKRDEKSFAGKGS